MSLARFMEIALMHPQYGYYSTKDIIFNKGGDFTTSPEISQMFGEMIAVWLMTALKNYNAKEEKSLLGDLQSINLVEIGPGTGIMMTDILNTLKQFSPNLKNIHVNLIEASPNLRKMQQDKLLKFIQENLKIFLSYDIQNPKQNKQNDIKQKSQEQEFPERDRFFNKDVNFSITWYSSLKEYYHQYLQKRLESLAEIQIKGKNKKKEGDNQQKVAVQRLAAQEIQMKNPCFLIAHELFDALPIHQFHYNDKYQWCEKVLVLDENSGELKFSLTEGPTDNTLTKLQPEKFFSEEAKKDLKPGDSIEICPEAISLTKDICSLLELSNGMGLIIDYGENNSFSNSFRGLKNHKLIKDEEEILQNIGNIDLTSYVNFNQISQVAKTNKQIIAEGPMPQGQFLECMGIAHRVEALQKLVKGYKQKQDIYKCYERLCSPEQMGAIYKILYIGDKNAGEVYPFLSEETIKKQSEIYE